MNHWLIWFKDSARRWSICKPNVEHLCCRIIIDPRSEVSVRVGEIRTICMVAREITEIVGAHWGEAVDINSYMVVTRIIECGIQKGVELHCEIRVSSGSITSIDFYAHGATTGSFSNIVRHECKCKAIPRYFPKHRKDGERERGLKGSYGTRGRVEHLHLLFIHQLAASGNCSSSCIQSIEHNVVREVLRSVIQKNDLVNRRGVETRKTEVGGLTMYERMIRS